MSAFAEGVDPFEGVRTFPRDPEQLLHHLSRINHTLQTRYYIAPEIAEFALQPEKSADFHRFYQKEVQQIIAHLNKSTGSNIKVRVDGKRYARGVEILRAGQPQRHHHDRHAVVGSSVPRADKLEEGDSNWQASMIATSRKLAEQQNVNQQYLGTSARGEAEEGCVSPAPPVAGGVTPAYSTRKHAEELYVSTGGRRAAIVDSMAKPARDNFLFTTPPEFKGFKNIPNATPSSEADGRSPLGY